MPFRLMHRYLFMVMALKIILAALTTSITTMKEPAILPEIMGTEGSTPEANARIVRLSLDSRQYLKRADMVTKELRIRSVFSN